VRAFQDAVDLFVEQVRGQLRAVHVGDTNLDDIWNELLAERADPETSERRRLEALMGFDPDEAAPQQIETLVADAKSLGDRTMSEVAAGRELLTAKEFGEIAQGIPAPRLKMRRVYQRRYLCPFSATVRHGNAVPTLHVLFETASNLARLRLANVVWQNWPALTRQR
jgi:hypothetical protein